MKRTIFTLGLLLAASLAQAQVAPGKYIAEHGFGTLDIKDGKFDITSVGGNGHTCGVQGEMKGATGVAEDEGDVCKIDFKAKDGGYEVTPTTPDTCRNYCGARAYFEGLYLKPAPGCADEAREATKKSFKTAYGAKDYAKAHALLAPVLQKCARTLGPMETASIRNDLAITLYHLGRKAECRKVLAPMAEDAARKDDDLMADYPPSDWDAYKPLIKAARTNLALCKG